MSATDGFVEQNTFFGSLFQGILYEQMLLLMFEKKHSYFGIKLSCFHMLVKSLRKSHRFSLLTSAPDNLMSKSEKFWIYVFFI